MYKKRIGITYIIFILIIYLVSTFSVSAYSGLNNLYNDWYDPSDEDFSIPSWNEEWSYFQEIKIPIETDAEYAIYQPIDIRIEFKDNCWADSKENHSIRICCWDGDLWHELESQIYGLNFTDGNHISSCNIVFLIPEFADGKEEYYVFYDDREKNGPDYIDHVKIDDEFYFFELISGISVEGDYYRITEDGFVVYGIGQKGKVMNRCLSQIIIKEQLNNKKFDILNSDLLSSFSISYQDGPDDSDEVSSDQVLVSKEILEDGNLMVEFGIISESRNGNLRTTNVYKYYYCPTSTKRINVHVKHEVLKESHVSGIEDVDGRYGAIISYKSRTAGMKDLSFGDILPYLHVYGENEGVKEYKLDQNPENKDREWIISHLDDCDLGSQAWLSYDEGENGKVHAILFSSNKDIVKKGSNERDGIEVKVAEREYYNAIGTDIDYASIAFGRNSYEPGISQDLTIPDDLVVEFDAEFFTIENGNYEDVIKEGNYFRILASHRHKGNGFEGDQNIYTLTIIPHLSGRIKSYPHLVNIFNLTLPVTWVELYQNETLISETMISKPIVGFQIAKFPKLTKGTYIVKIYSKIADYTKSFIGIETVNVQDDLTLHVYTTIEKDYSITIKDQNERYIKDVELILFKNSTIVDSNITNKNEDTILRAPLNLFKPYVLKNLKDISILDLFQLSDPYILKAYYKGFLIYNEEIAMLQKKVELSINIYDFTITIRDNQGFSPGVNVHPTLTSTTMAKYTEIIPRDLGDGDYIFEDIPEGSYELKIGFGGYTKTRKLTIPDIGEHLDLKFSAEYKISTKLFNEQGQLLPNGNQKIMIKRDSKVLYESLSPDATTPLPPGEYSIIVYDNDQIIGSKTIELTSDRDVKIVTKIQSIASILVLGLTFVFICQIIVVFILKKISLNTFLKLLAMSLIVMSMFLPWWSLYASNENIDAIKESMMYILPQTMIDSIKFEGKIYLDIATIPEMFTSFVQVLLFIIISGLIFMGISFIPNIVLRKRFSIGLILASVLFLILVAVAFSYGMNIIADLSLGSLQGEGMLDITLPNENNVNMNGTWGLGMGFYLCITSAFLLIATGVLDYLRGKHIISI